MMLIAFKQSKKQFMYSLILFMFLSFTLYGVTVSMSSQTYYTSFGMITTSKFNLELICLLIIVATYIFDLVLRHLPCKIHTNKLIYNLTLFKDNKSIKINAYLDTGNFINQNGQPVLILDLNTFLNLTQMNLCDFLLNKSETISTSTVNGDNKLKLFQVDKIQIQQKNFKNELKNQLVAISLNNCFKNTNYQALLSPLFL